MKFRTEMTTYSASIRWIPVSESFPRPEDFERGTMVAWDGKRVREVRGVRFDLHEGSCLVVFDAPRADSYQLSPGFLGVTHWAIVPPPPPLPDAEEA